MPGEQKQQFVCNFLRVFTMFIQLLSTTYRFGGITFSLCKLAKELQQRVWEKISPHFYMCLARDYLTFVLIIKKTEVQLKNKLFFHHTAETLHVLFSALILEVITASKATEILKSTVTHTVYVDTTFLCCCCVQEDDSITCYFLRWWFVKLLYLFPSMLGS